MPDSGLNTVVVGGGIWGLSTAYHLALTGASVRLLERNGDIAAETTPNAAGIIGQIRSSPTMCRAVQYALELCERLGAETGLDACGEQGEYHTLVLDGPLFGKSIRINSSLRKRKDSLMYLQIESVSLLTK